MPRMNPYEIATEHFTDAEDDELIELVSLAIFAMAERGMLCLTSPDATMRSLAGLLLARVHSSPYGRSSPPPVVSDATTNRADSPKE